MLQSKQTLDSKIMELIKAKIEDIQTLLEIEKTAKGLRVYSGYFNKEEIDEWIKNESIYIIENNSVVVGSISYEVKDRDHVCISGLVIKPEFQRQRLARQAMELLLDKLRGFKKLSLEVHPNNHAAKLYKSFGFVVESRKENYFGDGEPRLIMVKTND